MFMDDMKVPMNDRMGDVVSKFSHQGRSLGFVAFDTSDWDMRRCHRTYS